MTRSLLARFRRMKGACLSLLFSASLSAFALDTATIASSTLSPDCLEYRVVGVCFWLYCTYYYDTLITEHSI
jgi:hypothetical protein